MRQTYILGAGSRARDREGVVNVDIRPFTGINVVHDLEQTPWPFEDGCALHVNATHLFEHLQNFPAAMDECWRMLHPGGSLFFEVPVVQLNEAAIDLVFSDPTHRRFFRRHTFVNYLTVEGVLKHGIVRHAWTFVHLEELPGGLLRGHLFPVPDEALNPETVRLWKEYKREYSHGGK